MAIVAAAEEGSLPWGEARRVGVSQPALTKTVRELEVELSATLLVRTSKGVLPTAQGKVLYAHVVRVTREINAATFQISQLGGKMTGALKIGAVRLAVLILVPETLRTFGREFPDIRLRVSEELYIARLQRLRSGEVDVAVGGIPDDLSTGQFVVEQLMTTSMAVVVRKGSPRAKASSLAQPADAKLIYTSASSDLGYAKLLFERNGLPPPPIGAIVNLTLALLSPIANGGFVGLIPHQIAVLPLAAQFLAVVLIAEGGLPLSLGAIVRSDSGISPAIRHLIAHPHRAAHQATRMS